MLAFFDDILVYSRSLGEHWRHLEEVFELMKMNKMFAKECKSIFATDKIEYFWHFISSKGEEIDHGKIALVDSWLVPSNVQDLRSCL